MDNVSVAREAAQQVSHALDQRIVLRMDQYFGNQILAGKLN